MSNPLMHATQLSLLDQITKGVSAVYRDSAVISTSFRHHPLPLFSQGRIVDYHVPNIGPKVHGVFLELTIERLANCANDFEKWVLADLRDNRTQIELLIDCCSPAGICGRYIIYRYNTSDGKIDLLPLEESRLLVRCEVPMRHAATDEIINWVSQNCSSSNPNWQNELRELISASSGPDDLDYQIIDANELKEWINRQKEMATKLSILEQKVNHLLAQPRVIPH